ncbi:MAG: orotidine-5'-phosphate decarboxylase, partial [Glaciecola sp.]|nr:orotidine-5'-phosphate decarboxylase [Glaciecola sp.]
QAMSSGVNYMVIGRPITQAQDPLSTLLDINRTIY